MKTWLSPPTREFSQGEFSAVVGLAFGLAILGSLSAASSWTNQPIVFNDTELAGTVGFELIVGTVIFLLLRHRGWTWSHFEVRATTGSTIVGVLIAGIVLALWLLLEALLGKVPSEVDVTMPWIAITSIINPAFEEMLVLGYVVQAMRKRFGLATGINVSIAIRVLYHLYQGPMAVLPIAVMGAIVAVSYVRLGRLWPAIVAHAILDFVALAGWFE